MNSVLTVVMITMTHTTTGIPTVRYRPDQLVGDSVVGTIVTDDVMMELTKGQLLPTQEITMHTKNSVTLCILSISYSKLCNVQVGVELTASVLCEGDVFIEGLIVSVT